MNCVNQFDAKQSPRGRQSSFLGAAAAGVLTAVLAGTSARAAVVVNDTFDTYANQAAFEATWTPIGTVAPLSAELSTAQAVSAPNSVRVPGTAANNQSRNRRTFTDTPALVPSEQLVWSFDFYDSAPTASPQRNSANLQDTTGPTATNQLVSMGFNNNQNGTQSGGQFYMARILGYTPPTVDPHGGPDESVVAAGSYFKLNDFGVGTRSLGWHNLAVVMTTDDGASTDYAFYVDGVLAERVDNVGTAASLRQYDNITLGSGLSNGSTEAFFDNVRLESGPIPEPGSVGLLGLAACGVLARRRRSR